MNRYRCLVFCGGILQLFCFVGWFSVEAFACQASSREESRSLRETAVLKVCERILEKADEIPSGDEGFVQLTTIAFRLVHSQDTIVQSPSIISDTPGNMSAIVENNKVAILSLAVLVGEDRIRTLARFRFSLNSNNVETLRNRVTVLNRNDLSKHFWVSAGLTVLSGEKQAIAVGVGKELMDSAPGGSGFSFVDLLADQAGIRFAANAISDEPHAIAIRDRIEKGLVIQDVMPSIDALPEGISTDRFQTEYGGMGGKKTRELLKDIQFRLESCWPTAKQP